MTMKILLDTDIGSDIDDAVCLAYLLANPACELLGITTVSGEPERRAMLASAQCRVAGREVPSLPDVEPSFDSMKARIAETLKVIEGIPAGEIDGRGIGLVGLLAHRRRDERPAAERLDQRLDLARPAALERQHATPAERWRLRSGGHGAPRLRRTSSLRMIASAISFFDFRRCRLWRWITR